MIALRTLLRRLDRIILGPPLAEIAISRKKQTIFGSNKLPAFYDDVQSQFGVKFTAREMRKTDNMDDLMALVREKHFAKHKEHINPHGIWGTLKRLAEKHVKS